MYSPDIVFLEDEKMEPLNGKVEEKYDEWYESLMRKQHSFNEHEGAAKNDEMEDVSDDGDYFEKECSSNSRPTGLIDRNQAIDKAIDDGHILVERGSQNVDISIENLVNLARRQIYR